MLTQNTCYFKNLGSNLFQQLPGSKRDPADVAGHLLAVLLMHVLLVELQACLVVVGVVLEFCFVLCEPLLSEVHFPGTDF